MNIFNKKRIKANTNADLKIYQYRRLYMKIICWSFHIKTPFTFWDIHTWDILRYEKKLVCKHSETIKCVKSYKEIYKLHGQITRKLLGLRVWNFQCSVFIWTPTYREIFKLHQCTFKDIAPIIVPTKKKLDKGSFIQHNLKMKFPLEIKFCRDVYFYERLVWI